jgi:tRNA(Arg) A34 adenosine deaminase TadA
MEGLKQHYGYIERAFELAKTGSMAGEGGPFGAVVVREHIVLGTGHNRVLSENDPTAHAEIIAIRAACHKLYSHRLDDCVLYTTCEPCPMCLGAILWSRLSKVFYASTRQDAADIGFDDSFFYEQTQRDPDQRIIPFIHLPLVKVKILMENWQRGPNSNPY